MAQLNKKVHLIANKKSGTGKGADLASQAKSIRAELGWELIDYPISSPDDFTKQSEIAVEAAVRDGGVVIAAGGDGTIRGVAHAAAGKAVRFAAVPCGTFNLFARDHNIPEDPAAALKLALTGDPQPVRLGDVNGHTFILNASLGLYAKAIQERKASTKKFGRKRIVAILSTIVSLFKSHKVLKVDLVMNGETRSVKTPTIFIGNNALQLRNLGMEVATCFEKDQLAVVMSKRVTRLETLRIIARGLFNKLEEDERVETFCVEDLIIHSSKHPAGHPIDIALDGELIQMHYPLRIKVLPKNLNLVVPSR